jgi:outer membrane protein TolC
MKKLLIFFTIVVITGILTAQVPDTISLEECFRMANERFTGSRQIAPLTEASGYRIKNYNARWFPTVSLTGQATYQSETVQMKTYDPIAASYVTIDLPLDQYKFQAEFSQQLFDGGITRVQKELEKNALGIDVQQVEVELHAFKQIINQLYFSVVLMEKSHQILSISLNELRERKSLIESGVNHGVVIPDNLNAIKAEELVMEQRILDIDITRTALLNQLSILLDTTFTPTTNFLLPGYIQPEKDGILRPEYAMFDLQKQQLTTSKKLLTAGDLPKISAFSQVGYGRPGFDFLNESFHEYYIVGVGLKWNLIRYGETRRQKKVLDLNRKIIDIRQETFDKNLMVTLESEWQNIRKYREMVDRDKKIVELRKSVTSSSFSKLNNGVITPTDFLADMNAEIQAKMQLENHEIMMLQSICNYLLGKGDI